MLTALFVSVVLGFSPNSNNINNNVSTYTETLSQRLRFDSSKPPQVSLEWKTLPFDNIIDSDCSWIASSTTIASASVQFQTNVIFSRIENPLAMNLGTNIKLIVDSKDFLLGIATPSKLLALYSEGNIGCPPSNTSLCEVKTYTPPSSLFAHTPSGLAASWGNVSSVEVGSNGWYIGTTIGLFFFNCSSQQISRMDSLPASNVFSLLSYLPDYNGSESAGKPSFLVVGTQDQLFFVNEQTQKIWRQEWVTNTQTSDVSGGVIDNVPLSLSFHQKSQSIFIGTCCSLSRLFLTNFTFFRIGPLEGLPSGNLFSIHVEETVNKKASNIGGKVEEEDIDRIWLASTNAIIIWEFDSFSSSSSSSLRNEWNYFSGPRFLPGGNVRGMGKVSDLTDNGQPGALVFTDSGLSVFVLDSTWTLENKALSLEPVRERHSRYGLVDSCYLEGFGVLTNCTTKPSDNDGLWTSLIASAEVFRWASTKNEEARQIAWTHLRAMEMLNEVTGIAGLPARSIYQSATVPPSFNKDWQPSNAPCCKGQWIWQGDTSSDEIIGHIFAYSTAYFLLAQTDAERAEIGNLLLSIINYIIENNFYLIDSSGKPTTWGRWNAKELNLQRNFSDNRGINSLEIAAFIKAAMRICAKEDLPKYTSALAQLVKEGYPTNLLNAKITAPDDDNYSDDELLFLVYGLYFMDFNSTGSGRSVVLKDWDKDVKTSFLRSFENVKKERSAFWNSIFLATMKSRDKELQDDLLWNLQTFPTEFINWPYQNSDRWDVHLRKQPGVGERAQTEEMLPYREGGLLVWNTNPYYADGPDNGSNGFSEESPAGYMLPFWMSTYFKLV